MTGEARVAVPGSYTPVRAVAAPECPFDAWVARGPDGGSVLLVDRDALADWPGWSANDEEHVMSPLDVVRRADGHDVVLPLVRERLDRLLARRGAASTPLTDGERVTVAVSILRGLSRLLDESRDSACAQWWLTDDGRPMIVEGCGDASPRRASAEVLTALLPADAPSLDATLARLADSVADPRTRSIEWDAAEEELFSRAAAEPLATEVIATRRSHAPVRSATALEAPMPTTGERRSWWQSMGFHLDAGLAEMASDSGARVGRAFARVRGARRMPVFVAVGAAATVLGVGLLWPATADDGSVRSGEVVAPAAHVEETSPSTEQVAPTGGLAENAAPDAALAALLDRRMGCTEDACRSSVLQDPGRALVGGAVDADPAVRTISLVDDLGGLAVLRVTTTDGSKPEQFVTIVNREDGWRVRDAYLVAHPPS